MKRNIIKINLIVLILIGLCTSVFAENMDEIKNRKNELQEKIQESSEQVQDIQIKITENLEQLNELEEKIANYENEVNNLQIKLDELQEQIDTIRGKLQIVQDNYNTQKNALQNRIVSLYEAGDILYLDVLLSSDSVSDFISNYFLIGEIARYDSNLLDNIENQKTQIENAKNTLDQKQKEIKAAKESKEKTTIALENARVIKNTYIEKLTDEEKQTQEKIEEYKTELNSLESQIVAIATADGIEEYVGGEFLWPTPGYKTITSPYGYRMHPILHYWRLHTGIDIGAPIGANIVAANDGVIIASKYTTNGYGNMVMIDHGGGIVTMYGHGSELVCEVRTRSKKR